MASNMLDSMLYCNSYSTEEMRTIFDDKTFIQNVLDIEKALATVQADLGIIPREAAREICKKGFVEYLDIDEIQAGIVKVGHSLVPILKNFQKACDGGYGEYIHLGATTQDIMDTGFMLSVKRGFEAIYRDALETEDALLELTNRYADTVMAGRTHGQQAIPITFGYKTAVWASELHRDIRRMDECRRRCFTGQLSGAVGSMAGFGSQGREVSARAIRLLGLDVPDIAWHVSRDRFAEIASVLSILGCTLGKIGQELVYLQGTETAEAAEGFVPGSVGSSTMPHKRNPNGPEAMVYLSRLAKTNMAATFDSMYEFHERDGAAWKIEWLSLNQTVMLVGGAVAKAKKVLKNLTVDAGRMQQNLTLLKGLMMSEQVMLKLGEVIGKQTAHEVIYQVSMAAFEEGAQFKDKLLENELVAANLTEAELDALLNPSAYTGHCADIARSVYKKINEERTTKEEFS